ncbi:arabinan endo-1,5-alpha-L-arabinosidase [Flavobacterium flevense]|uniref:Arabinan endo-1,5-alpha-L-arabinosidase n=1 Tax=Flavobacterium flevense TaxID=983 RepID=A0A4Y4AXU1_9FLAO|nr:arabinan endo-1,5-alpha-L-arabinosidase [Flavobacterium flevense]GEC71233.1 arabinan endo-1,5-alpha-L-arabinosidase [Flavobacterium flevense]SHM05675.1 arabinan endo-1,5-alpha-L-arabinosidase [Flavobacterium flevense]
MKNSKSILKKASFVGFLLFVLAAVSCSKDDPTTEETVPPIVVVPPVVTPTFNGPKYADNYTSIASWSSRSQWNLANVHDPTVEKSGEYYYMYQTDASYGNAHDGHGHFPYRRSKDLITWEFMGTAMALAPAWVKDSLNNKRARMVPALPPIANPRYGYWAPFVKKVGNKYRMYYSIVVDEPITGTSFDTSWSERAFIGLAESDDLASNVWVDKGMVVCSEPDGLKPYSYTGARNWEDAYFKFNAIDPTFTITPEGEHYLIYGSWHSGIAALKLNPTTGKPDQLKTLSDYGTRIASRHPTSRWQASEGPEIIYNPDTQYYYLFLAYDELSVAYNTRVARSRSITGPFLGINGANITNGADCWPMLTHPYSFNNHTGWVGFSHCSVFQNPDTKEWFYASQARLPEGVPGINASNAVMMGHVRAIQWTEDGWPVVDAERYAGVPKTTITEASFVGQWEQITMNYQYKTIQKSVTINLTADKKVSGALTGTWSYDSGNKTLIVNGIKCKVSDAWDWEASTRKVTLSYSGLTADGRPVWGKKK